MYASHAERMDRLRETYTLIISGSATTEQTVALLLVIVLQTVYIVSADEVCIPWARLSSTRYAVSRVTARRVGTPQRRH